MKLKNSEIYTYAQELMTQFGQDCSLRLPAKINYWLQKNIKKIQALGQEIDESRVEIARNYGKINEDGTAYQIPPENLEAAQTELTELFDIEQDVPIHQFDIDEFNNIELEFAQMSAIEFMIKDTDEAAADSPIEPVPMPQ